ncbi:50S ribosomal protein L25/general stress protein Ctc [Marinilabiliaceae bacterium JC017]|nr:50S ribosomal protein L25/general stress protein Ctc [Marinilabiliaceae bacterium JC017]
MKTIDIKGFKREETGKSATKQLRQAGSVPCVLYGGEEVAHFSTPQKDMRNLFYTPNVYIVKLNIDGKEVNAILQDVQFHPVTDEVIHIDFLQIKDDKPVVIEIPVKLEGFAEGVKAGGKLQLEMRKLKVKALAKDLPDTLNINIDHLGLGKATQVGELNFENLELLNAKNAVVVAVRLTRAARAAQQKA